MRLIDADALSSDICKDCNAVQNGACNYDICPLVAWIEEAPTIEAELVRHGEWKESISLDDCFWVCSVCSFPSEATAAPTLYKFCPNCGAKMDGDSE